MSRKKRKNKIKWVIEARIKHTLDAIQYFRTNTLTQVKIVRLAKYSESDRFYITITPLMRNYDT